MGFQQAGGGFSSAGLGLSAPGTHKMTLNTALTGYRADFTSGSLQVYGSGPFRVVGKVTRGSGSAAITALLRKNGVATNLASGSAGTTSTFATDITLCDTDVLDLYVSWAASADSITGGATATFLYFEPIAPNIQSNSVSMARAALF